MIIRVCSLSLAPRVIKRKRNNRRINKKKNRIRNVGRRRTGQSSYAGHPVVCTRTRIVRRSCADSDVKSRGSTANRPVNLFRVRRHRDRFNFIRRGLTPRPRDVESKRPREQNRRTTATTVLLRHRTCGHDAAAADESRRHPYYAQSRVFVGRPYLAPR